VLFTGLVAAQVLPVLGREVIEGQEHVAALLKAGSAPPLARESPISTERLDATARSRYSLYFACSWCRWCHPNTCTRESPEGVAVMFEASTSTQCPGPRGNSLLS
jgi:hypothetical protein